MEITLDRQVVTQRCPECAVNFTVVRGSVYDSGERFGLYLIALHGHSPEGRLAHLAVAILDRTGAQPVPLAAAIRVSELAENFGFTFVDWPESPWKGETYLGRMLTRAEVLSSEFRPLFLHAAEHVVNDLPEVARYFG